MSDPRELTPRERDAMTKARAEAQLLPSIAGEFESVWLAARDFYAARTSSPALPSSNSGPRSTRAECAQSEYRRVGNELRQGAAIGRTSSPAPDAERIVDLIDRLIAQACRTWPRGGLAPDEWTPILNDFSRLKGDLAAVASSPVPVRAWLQWEGEERKEYDGFHIDDDGNAVFALGIDGRQAILAVGRAAPVSVGDEPRGDEAYENGRSAKAAGRSLRENPETGEATYARWATGWLDEHHGKPRVVKGGGERG